GGVVWGHLGLRQQVWRDSSVYANDTWDLLYYDLQLLVLGPTPLQNGGTIPLSLQIARFMAPAVTVYAVIEAARLLFASELARLRARSSRGHDVVCGNSLVAQALTDRLCEERRRVVRLGGGEQAPRPRRLLFLPGDPTNADVLRIAGLQRAKTLYVCSADAAQNLAVVIAAAEIRRRRRVPLNVHVQ